MKKFVIMTTVATVALAANAAAFAATPHRGQKARAGSGSAATRALNERQLASIGVVTQAQGMTSPAPDSPGMAPSAGNPSPTDSNSMTMSPTNDASSTMAPPPGDSQTPAQPPQ